LDREKTYLSHIKDLKDRLLSANEQLQIRADIVTTLQKQVKRVDQERQKAVRSETFAKEREQRARELIRDLKKKVCELETTIHKATLPGTETINSDGSTEESEQHDINNYEIERSERRQQSVCTSSTPFDEWKKKYGVWASDKPKKTREKPWRKAERQPRTAFQLYAATCGYPHAHEIATAYGADRCLTPMDAAKRQLALVKLASNSSKK